MDKSDYDPSKKQKEFVVFSKKDSDSDSNSEQKEFKYNLKEDFHLNSLITKNISLFTKDPNYKLFAWLMVQLFIFSLFVLAVTFMKNNLVPYFNSP